MLDQREKEAPWGGEEMTELREAKWEQALDEKLEKEGKHWKTQRNLQNPPSGKSKLQGLFEHTPRRQICGLQITWPWGIRAELGT